LTKQASFDIIKENDKKVVNIVNTLAIKQSDIQELLHYAQQNKVDFYIAGSKKNPLIAFLEKYANNFTYKVYKIGGLECTKKLDFKSTVYKGFCTFEEFQAERQLENSPKQGIVEVVDFEDYSYLTRDEAGTYLIEFYDFGIQNPHEFAEVDIADLEDLVSFAESSGIPKYNKFEDGSFALNVFFAFVSSYTQRELNSLTIETKDKKTGFTSKTISLTTTKRFKELWYNLDQKYSCNCDFDCDCNCDSYNLSYIRRFTKLKEGLIFDLETPTKLVKYIHSVSFPSSMF
jgi:hypothetical protein